MKTVLTIFCLFLIVGISFAFYYMKMRPEGIKKTCYLETKIPRSHERDFEWVEGKEWGYALYKPMVNAGWGWIYPDRNWGASELTHLSDIKRQEYLYESCLRSRGI